MLQIKDTLVSLDLVEQFFLCDLDSCHGECCIEGDAGAPVTLDEVADIEEILPFIEDKLSVEARGVIEAEGVAYIDREGELVTQIVDGRDCVFATRDERGNCLCAIEMTGNAGVHSKHKPISCSLYPIRVKEFNIGSNGEKLYGLNYRRWPICREAVEKGHRLSMPVYRFLKEPLVRRFGSDWYAELEEAAREIAAAKF